MKRTLEAVIDKTGRVELLEPATLAEDSRALVTILDEAPLAAIAPTTPTQLALVALLEGWNAEFGESADPDLDAQLRALEQAQVRFERP